MDVSIKNLRSLFADQVGEDLMKLGFKMDKGITSFTKKNGKNKIKILLHCYDFKPSKIEFELIFQIWIGDIVKETEKYHNYLNEFFSKEQPTFTFSEQEFNPQVQHIEPKIRKSYTHVIVNERDYAAEIESCNQLLLTVTLPHLFLIYNDLTTFQKFVIENYKTIGISTVTNPSLIAMKLVGLDNLRIIVDYYWNEKGFKLLGNEHIVRRYTENIMNYATSYRSGL